MNKNVTVVVGGQYGSEAKAKAAVAIGQSFDQQGKSLVGVRCGGPNAGHTVYFGDTKRVLRLVPSLCAIPSAQLVICSGALVDVGLLRREIDEIEQLGVPITDRLFVSKYASSVDMTHINTEKIELGLGQSIGSTQTGTGAATADRVMRTATLLKDLKYPPPCLCDVDNIMKSADEVIVEGTQGFGLDLYHSHHYPFCTSKSTTASAFIAEAGISPLDVKRITMVIRTYPIRVGGNSGPMLNEISWDEVAKRCGSPEPLIEMTSVTKKVRRVGEFDWDLLKRAIDANKPTDLAVHGVDYLDWRDRGVKSLVDLSFKSTEFLMELGQRSGVKVSMIFTGPHQDDIIRLY